MGGEIALGFERGHAPHARGRDRLTVGFEGMARYFSSSSVALSMELTTINSTY